MLPDRERPQHCPDCLNTPITFIGNRNKIAKLVLDNNVFIGEWKWRTECAAELSLDGKEGFLPVKPYSGDLEIYRRGFVKAYPQWKCFTYADGTIDEKDITGFRIYDRAFQTVADAGLVHANAQFFFPQQLKSQLATDTNALRWLSRYWVARVVAHKANKNLCEPFALRSPDRSEIALIMRENRHTGTSMMAFSRDEGKTWTEPADTCWGLTGDRHQGVHLPDGRWLIAFRDRAIGSSTYGQYVAWVGTYDDMLNARPGQCRVHLLRHHGVPGVWPGNEIDTGYSGVELLPDGTVLCTTYTRHWADERLNSVVMTRFNVSELPKADGVLVFNEDNSAYASGRKYGGAMTEQGLRDYVKEIA